MNTKSLLASLLLLTILVSSVQGLTIKNTQKHQAVNHMAKEFTNGLNHMISSTFHLKDNDKAGTISVKPQLPSGPLTIIPPQASFESDLTSFALKDDDLFKSIVNGTPLSAEASKRVKDFIKGNENFQNQLSHIFEGSECMKKLSKDQKKSIVNIFVDNIDIGGLISGESKGEADPATLKKVMEAIKNDSSLGESVVSCIAQTK